MHKFETGDTAIVTLSGETVTVIGQSGQDVLAKRGAWSGGGNRTYGADQLRQPGICPVNL